VLHFAEHKLMLGELVLRDTDEAAAFDTDSTDGADDKPALDTRELLRIVRHGSRAVGAAADADPASLDIDALLADSAAHAARARAGPEVDAAPADEEIEESAAAVDIRAFEGVQYAAAGLRSVVDEWLAQVAHARTPAAAPTAAAAAATAPVSEPEAGIEGDGSLRRSRSGRALQPTVQAVPVGGKGSRAVAVSRWALEQAARERRAELDAAAARDAALTRPRMGHEVPTPPPV
jgi:hypothetical protein